jgi:hypothetical protein
MAKTDTVEAREFRTQLADTFAQREWESFVESRKHKPVPPRADGVVADGIDAALPAAESVPPLPVNQSCKRKQ